MRCKLIAVVLALFAGAAHAISSCPVTVGTLTLSATVTRTTGISPLLVFFDATATTDSGLTGNQTPFQDVTYHWNFSDSGASGKGNWQYGSGSAYSSKNHATGPVGAHLYIVADGSGDKTFYPIARATDGTNTATCELPAITVYDAAGTNGFSNTATTCYYNSTVGSGCPSGATQTASSTLHAPAAGKRVLYKCGDTFTGAATVNVTKWSVGAYGSCVGTTSGRPILTGYFTVGASGVDGRVADLDWESVGGTTAAVTVGVSSQITLYNLLSNGNDKSYYIQDGTQIGLIALQQTGMGSNQGTYVNYAQNNCVNGSQAYNCGGTPSFVDIDYTAMIGGSFDGSGAPTSSNGIETIRVSACRKCVIENNVIKNANNVGAVLKLHNGNYYNTQCIWLGQYTELMEVSDNYFTGKSGAQLVEITPQNSVTDERMRYIIVERNLFNQTTGTNDAISWSVNNGAVRDNVFNGINQSGVHGIKLGQRGYEWTSNNAAGSTCSGTGTTAAPVDNSEPQLNEVYNNSFYAYTTSAIDFGSGGELAGRAGNNSWAENNMAYNTSGAAVTANSGSGNTISNNTATTTNNPNWTNASGTLLLISDFKPTANYSGASNTVPVFYDALGVTWSPTWDLGAVHH